MEMGFTEEQEMLRRTAREYLEKEFPRTLVRSLESDSQGYSPAHWKEMADMGWLGFRFPEAYGGLGSSFVDLAILYEEFGRAMPLTPHFATVALCAEILMAMGSPEQQRRYLPRIAQGELIMSLAFMEPSAIWDANGVAMAATLEDGSFTIDGTKLFVPYAHAADTLIVAVRSKRGRRPEQCISLLLVDTSAPRLTVTALETIGRDKQCEVTFDNVRVPRANLIGSLHGGWPGLKLVLDQAAALECAQLVGLSQQVLDMSVVFAKHRVQFGRVIGAFQGLQHVLAQFLSDLEAARLMTYQAVWRMSEGLTYERELSMAKAFVNELAYQAIMSGHQTHGGVGYMHVHDLPMFTRRAMAGIQNLGDTDVQRERVAHAIGLD